MTSQESYLIDSHCHIHEADYGFDALAVIEEARTNGVGQLICIGTSALDSEKAVEFAHVHSGVWASVGLHPHDAKMGEDDFEVLARLVANEKVVAIGECGLDYWYENSPRDIQKQALRYQLSLADSANKPCIFHVRDPKNTSMGEVGEAFADFFAILDEFEGIRGVVHSFSANITVLNEITARGLYVGLNGIMTFTKDAHQLEAAKNVDLSKIVLETDAPFLTPTPKRGTINSPANVRLVAAFLAELREEPLESLIKATTVNAHTLFGLSNDQL